jgi:hypothetical protein
MSRLFWDAHKKNKHTEASCHGQILKKTRILTAGHDNIFVTTGNYKTKNQKIFFHNKNLIVSLPSGIFGACGVVPLIYNELLPNIGHPGSVNPHF